MNIRFLNLCLFACVIGIMGCAGVNPPSYIRAENPYKRTYYGSFDDVANAVRTTLQQDKWQIVKEVDPTLYERNPLYNAGEEGHVLILTNVKKAFRVVYFKTTHLNVYVNRISDGIEVDIRYASTKNFHLWKSRSYRNNVFVNKMLDRIDQKLLPK